MAQNTTRQGHAQRQLQDLLNRATTDMDFRTRLLADPKGTVAAEVGAQIPENINVRVLEDSQDTVHLVLPPPRANRPLTDAELESVAGGECAQWGGNSWSSF
jgi:hypothetical protein